MELKLGKSEETCSRCKNQLGFRKFTPYEEWGYQGKLCKKCFDYIDKKTPVFEAEYIDGYSEWKEKIKGKISIHNFDNVKRIFFYSKNEKYELEIPFSEIQNVEIADYEMKHQKNLLGKDTKLYKECLQISCTKKGQQQRIVFSLGNDLTINAFFDFNVTFRFGNIILKANNAEYYGGHKKYLAGGYFDKYQLGTMYLTNTHLIFSKSDKDITKIWKIVIPINSVIINRWRVEEESRRKSIVGGGTTIGDSGFVVGGGSMNDSGKAHHIVIPYLDENNIPQEPRFGVSSFGGKAIREWSAKIYELVVQAQKNTSVSDYVPTEERKTEEDPLKILKLRFAKGEITKEQFEEMKKTLE